MYCKNCGNELNENAVACMNCGFAKGNGERFCANCGNEINPGAAICVKCGAAVQTAAAAGIGEKSKLVAVLLAFFLGSLGIHDFYLGYTKYGVIKIILTVCTGVGGSIWALIDFIRLLTGSLHTDANGVELKKEF
ncbi:MAG: NINE protein [Clostridia bacterium]|nr:NINE protein [Clostridia bacterium]MBR4086563.1 NINE protein [Clostridia bacterium]